MTLRGGEHVNLKRTLTIALASSMLFVACNSSASPAPSFAVGTQAAATPSAAASSAASVAPSSSVAPSPLAADPAEALIKGVESGAEITFWTFYLSPTFDNYIKETIARFEATYPGVKVNWEDHQGTFQDDLKNAFAAGNAPDVINLSVSEGWVSDYASRGLLLNLDDKVDQSVKDIYFPGLWKEQLVDGKNYQFPWYQGLNVELINKRLFETAGVDPAAFPKSIDGLPDLCKTLHEKAKTVCDIRLTVNDLIAQMVYEGNVKPISDDGKTFTFDSPEAVAWLQMYVDMVKAGTVDTSIITTKDDRTGLLLFSAGQAPFYATGPNLIRDVKSNNETLYNDLAVAMSPLGKSNVTGKGLMSISVKADTKFPNASIALAQYFTNPRSMVEFSQQVAVYPSSPKAFEDPFFSSASGAIEDSAKPLAKDIIATYADIVPTIPKKPDVNDLVLKAVEAALFSDTPAQQALSDAVKAANELIK
jgi:putative chitobiose transport system substrate-binding protein